MILYGIMCYYIVKWCATLPFDMKNILFDEYWRKEYFQQLNMYVYTLTGAISHL